MAGLLTLALWLAVSIPYGPTLQTSATVRHSQVTKQPYLFEIDSQCGSIWCYRACHPSPRQALSLFTLLSGAGELKFEIDSSNAPGFDFDILYFPFEKNELILSQVDLRDREIRSQSITLPSNFNEICELVSTQIVTFTDPEREHRAYDILSQEALCSPAAKAPIFLESVSIFTNKSKEDSEENIEFFLKKSQKFLSTGI